MKKTIALKVLTGFVSLSVSAAGVAGVTLPKMANMNETNEAAVVADVNTRAAEAAVETEKLINNDNWQKTAEDEQMLVAAVETAEDEQTFVAAAHADKNQVSVATAQTAGNEQAADDSQAVVDGKQAADDSQAVVDNKQAADDSQTVVDGKQTAADAGQSNNGNTGKSDSELVNAKDESQGGEIKGNEQKGELESKESEGDVEVEVEGQSFINDSDLPNVWATAECTVSGFIPGTGANKGDQTGDTEQKGPTYHCNCGFSTKDYEALKAHMLQHLWNGDKNSYTTI